MASPSPLLELPVLLADLHRVEERLATAVQATDPFLTEVASHLLAAGGKRIRPALTLVAAAARGTTVEPAPDAVVMGAVAVELVHLGSLYHDDVMDDASTRRAVESVNARWGNLKAILAGDYLLARASEIAASIGTEVAGLLASTIARLCEGQVLELQHTYDPARSEQAYLTSIEGKTASLLAASCRIGALAADLPRDHVQHLTDFGRCYGMAFQVVDDILDVVATDEELGKPAGNDLVEGVYTLPVLRTLASGGADSERLRQLLGGPLEHDQLALAREIVRRGDGVESALGTARDFIHAAVAAVAPLAGNEAASALTAATDHLLASATAVTA